MGRTFLAAFIGFTACSSGGTGGGGTTSSGSNGASGGNGTGGITVGPSLESPGGLVNTFTCADGFPVQSNAEFPQPFLGAGQSSCSVLTFLAPTGQTVKSGTLASATLRVPSQKTGPMRFLRMRALYNRKTGTKCCSLEQYGEPFTPTAGATTSVALGFPMTLDPLPAQDDFDSIIAGDVIALEVLAPDVPIPGFWTKNGGPELGTASYMWLPSLTARKTPAPSGELLIHDGSYSGFVPFFNITFAAQ